MLRTLIGWLITLCIVVLAVLSFLVTPLGFKTILGVADKLLPGELTYKSLDGTIIGPFSIQDLRYQQPGLTLSIGQLDLAWRPWTLLGKKLTIEKLTLSQVKIITEDTATPRPFTLSDLKSWLPQQPQKLHLPFTADIHQIDLDNLIWENPTNPYAIHLIKTSSTVTLLPDNIHIKLTGALTNSPITHVDLSAVGDLRHYAINLQVKSPARSWLITGQGSDSSIELNTQKAMAFQGQLNANLVLHWFPQIQWQIQSQAQQLNLKMIQTNLPRVLSYNLSSQGKLINQTPQFSWQARLYTPTGQADLSGEDKYLQWRVNIPRLQEWWSALSGSVNSQGEWREPLIHYATQGTMTANNLVWQDNKIAQFSGSWQLQQNDPAAFFKFSAQGVNAFARIVDRLALSGQGRLDQHTLALQLQTDGQTFNWQAQGGWQVSKENQGQWAGNITQLSIQQNNATLLSLRQTAALLIKAQRINLGKLCLSDNPGKTANDVCVQGYWQAGQAWELLMNGKLDLANLSSLLFARIAFSGIANLQGNIKGMGTQLQQAQIKLNLSAGQLKQTEKYKKAAIVNFNSGMLQTVVNDKGANLTLNLQLKDKSEINAQFDLPQYLQHGLANRLQQIKGILKIDIRNPDFFAILFPQIIAIKAPIKGQLTMDGNWLNPNIRGGLQTTGKVHILPINLEIDNPGLQITSQGRKLNYLLKAVISGKPLQVTGFTQSFPDDLTTEFLVKADNILAINTNEYQIYASPNIVVRFAQGMMSIKGNVDIPKGLLQPMTTQAALTLPEDDVIYQNVPITELPTVIPMQIDIKLTLGKDVKIIASGLTGTVAGQLALLVSPGQSSTGVGRITVHGYYEISDHRLDIDPASALIFRRSPMDDPYLGIQATKTVTVNRTDAQQISLDDLIVGVSIAGTARAPVARLFSNVASLSQADILSYLIFGTASQNISPANIGVLTQALNDLTFGRRQDSSGGLTSQIRQGLGFSELGVETETKLSSVGTLTDTQQTFFVLGKKISSRLHVSYKIDPLTAANIFQIQYLLSKRWQLQMEAGTAESGIDMFYTIEGGNAMPSVKSTDQPTANAKHE